MKKLEKLAQEYSSFPRSHEYPDCIISREELAFIAGFKKAREMLADKFSDESCVDHEKDGLCIASKCLAIGEEEV